MGGLRTLLSALFFAGSCFGPAVAGSNWYVDFAACSGRLSAQLEHQWLTKDIRSSQTEDLRDRMIELLEAVTAENNAVLVLSMRINAKFSQASLLQRATFSKNGPDAARARRRAEQEIAVCARMILNDRPEKSQALSPSESKLSDVAARQSESWPAAD